MGNFEEEEGTSLDAEAHAALMAAGMEAELAVEALAWCVNFGKDVACGRAR